MLMLVAHWANLNMWVNDIPLDRVNYGTAWHVGRLLAQTLLIPGIYYRHPRRANKIQRVGEYPGVLKWSSNTAKTTTWTLT